MIDQFLFPYDGWNADAAAGMLSSMMLYTFIFHFFHARLDRQLASARGDSLILKTSLVAIPWLGKRSQGDQGAMFECQPSGLY